MSDETPNPNPTDSGLTENLASALSYLLGLITGLVFILIEKKNETVRYHAAQSIIVTVGLVAVSIVIAVLSFILGYVPVLGPLLILVLSLAFSLACFAVWLGLMYLAFTGKKVVIPIVSDLAAKYSKPGAF